MDEVAQALRRALGVDTAQGGLVLQVYDRRTAGRTDGGHGKRLCTGQMRRHGDDLGDDIARFAHLDGIANADAEVGDDITVVQAGARHAGARQEDGVKHGGGRQHAGAADRNLDIADDALLDLGRVFERDGPARKLVGAAQGPAGSQVVDLDDCAVDIKLERAACFADGLNFLDGILDIFKHAVARRDREAQRLDIIQRFMVRHKAAPLALLKVKYKDGQPARRRDRGILLAQRTSGGVARVFERGFVLQLLLLFQLEKGAVRHVDLAAHLQKFRRVGQLVRDVLDRGNVLGDILAHYAVAAGGAAHQLAHAVFKADRQAVDLGFDDIFRLDTGLPHAGVKLAQFVKGERILQALHLDGVGHFAELAAGCAAHVLGGRSSRDQLRVLFLDGLQLTGQGVVLKILEFGGVLIVIQPVVFLYDHAQFFGAFACLLQFHCLLHFVLQG